MSEHSVFDWIQNLPLSTSIRESDWLFPTVETVHVIALVVVIGSIFSVDLKLLGLASRERTFSEVAREMLPWTWSAFAAASLAGVLMFASKATTYAANGPFRFKMIFIVLAGINMVSFHWLGARDLKRWDGGGSPPLAKFAGATSLLLWFGVVATGRWIGFTT